MKLKLIAVLLLGLGSFCDETRSHEFTSQATYLGNEGVMVNNEGVKILFDPFFHNSYGHYTLVPDQIRKAIFANEAPYNDIKALFISHAHEDHFDKNDVLAYLLANKKVKLVAPGQAVNMLRSLAGFDKIEQRVISIDLKKGDPPKNIMVDKLGVEAVRIPHAGWPGRADVENIVFRIKINGKMVVMHMGDADPDQSHFSQHKDFWPKQTTDVVFPPYWFLLSPAGQMLLDKVINVKKTIGVHVPTRVPQKLINTSDDYFSKPGETRGIKTK